MTISMHEGAFPKDFILEATLGNIPGYSQALLIGINPDLDIADGSTTVWDNKFNLTPLTANTEIFISSSSAADTGIPVLVAGLDSNNDESSAIAVLNGQTQVSIGFFTHVQSAVILGSATPAGDVYIATTDTLTGGVPDTNSTVKSKIIQGINITRNGFYKIPRGKSFITMAIRGTVDETNKNAVVTTHINQPITPELITVEYNISGSGLQWLFPAPVATTTLIGGVLSSILPEDTLIEFRAEASSNDTRVFFGADYLVIDTALTGNK